MKRTTKRNETLLTDSASSRVDGRGRGSILPRNRHVHARHLPETETLCWSGGVACKEWSAACAGVDVEEKDVCRLGCQRFATYHPGTVDTALVYTAGWLSDEEQSVVLASAI